MRATNWGWMRAAAAALAVLGALPALAQKEFPDNHRKNDAAWLAAPEMTLQLRWVFVQDHPQTEIRDGVCILYAPANNDEQLLEVEPLLRACAATGLAPARGAVAGTVQLHWHRAPLTEVTRRADEIFGRTPGFKDGFYYHPDNAGPCHIVTAHGSAAAGHELLHCIRGNFHYTNGRWKARAATGGTR